MSGKPDGSSRRSWGWHPLTPEWACRVVDAAGVRPGERVLDLGAGTGALTAPLLAAGARVTAVELHAGRAERLRQRFGDDVRVLELDLRELRWPHQPFRVVASPPYSVTTGLVRALLAADRLVAADLVVQRGAAGRLVDRPPRARHTRHRRLDLGLRVPRGAFAPPPRVDSVVLRISRRGRST
ncbi:rRNA adenine N-6-methyltransferase family protein [Nocardioides aequoreus]|uniref:rRNA adenine N-6-methyltransferase family protein n=1 Tax=Nocardioides aequoreus TaxID=397278 RepID=UPI0004C33AB2|nr:rRNA adenine N-6-methyltransferase family protein [Nocardioides aequoreus]